jgi:hypothetical protein
MKTASTNKKIREIIAGVKEGKLLPRPEFQRRLVWSRDDKNLFLDTILRGFPFPEIYLADGDVDLETGGGTQLLVDGLQRVSTITQYFNGDSDLRLTIVPPYKDLPEDQKKAFLQYDVSVRDLGAIDRDTIIEVFKRINSTKYPLLDIEVNNALYMGSLKKFAETMVEGEFFRSRRIFTSADYKRMGDLRFGVLVVGTLLAGYFNRDDLFEELLDRYNDDFPKADRIAARLEVAMSFIDECGFDDKSRIWRKADLFTAIVELDRALNLDEKQLEPLPVAERLVVFFHQVDAGGLGQDNPAGIYYKAALQASNDRLNRLRRGLIMYGAISGQSDAEILQVLKDAALV